MTIRENKGGRGNFGKGSGDQWEEKDSDFKMPKSRCEFGEESDYGTNPVSHRLASLVESGGDGPTDEFATETQGNYFRPRALKGGDVGNTSPNRYGPKGYYDTHPVSAESPEGKFAKKGGSGQRSGK